MKKLTTRIQKRNRRKARVRSRVLGTTERPRLSVFRSLKSLYVQIIDDTKGTTLVGMKHDEPQELGKQIAAKAIALGIKKVVFDRAGYAYHGRVKAVADGAREGGLEF
jgi:large subunit ribosomal protein L18